MRYLASFYSHFGAIRYKRLCQEEGIEARIMPIPRDLSSSCGSCVCYQAVSPRLFPDYLDELEQVVEVVEGGYRLVYRAENA